MKEKKIIIFFIVTELQPGTDECEEDSFAVGEGKGNE